MLESVKMQPQTGNFQRFYFSFVYQFYVKLVYCYCLYDCHAEQGNKTISNYVNQLTSAIQVNFPMHDSRNEEKITNN